MEKITSLPPAALLFETSDSRRVVAGLDGLVLYFYPGRTAGWMVTGTPRSSGATGHFLSLSHSIKIEREPLLFQ